MQGTLGFQGGVSGTICKKGTAWEGEEEKEVIAAHRNQFGNLTHACCGPAGRTVKNKAVQYGRICTAQSLVFQQLETPFLESCAECQGDVHNVAAGQRAAQWDSI